MNEIYSTHGSHFADDIFRIIFFDKNCHISIQISLKFVPKDPNNNLFPALVQATAWNQLLSEPMMT